jgi:NitT/TauT family transport system permease protein
MALLILILALWEFGSGDNLIRILPKPSVILSRIIEIWPVLWRNLKQTTLEAIVGFICGTSLGVSIAIGFIYSRNIARTVYPFAVLIRSLPLLAILPLLVSWFGPGMTSKTILITLATFFPTLVNMVQGLSSVDRNALELMKTLNASRKQIFWKVRFPYSLPYLFTSIKITLTASILAAIISEWLWASKGLGAFMVNAMFNAQVNSLWAAMTISTALSICAYITAVILEKLVIPWHSVNLSEKPGA